MYSKEEIRQIKTEFWTSFGQFSQLKRERIGYSKKWMLYKTDIKGLELKFDFLEKNAIVTIEIDSKHSKSDDYIQKIKLLQDELISEEGFELFFESQILKDNFKPVYRIFYEKPKLSYRNKPQWPEIFNFFFDHMMVFEAFINENKDILKA